VHATCPACARASAIAHGSILSAGGAGPNHPHLPEGAHLGTQLIKRPQVVEDQQAR
jgi:hypothetical protein